MSAELIHVRPDFSALDYAKLESQLEAMLSRHRQTLNELEKIDTPTWQNFMWPQEQLDNELTCFWSPVSHLNSVMNSDELREAYNACLPRIREFSTEIAQNETLYELTKALKESDEFAQLTNAQQRVIDNTLRDFRLGGVSLNTSEKERFKEIALELSKLQNRFSENLLDATNAWQLHITDEKRLSGLPEHALRAAQQRAADKSLTGWLLNLEFPTYYAVMTFADDASLREELYTAYCTRASDQGPHDAKYDNSELMDRILALRVEKASLLGYDSYAELSVVPKMVQSPEQVLSFLDDLAARSASAARTDMQALQSFAEQQFGVKSLQAWDLMYFSDKLRKHAYDISEEDLKPYFPASRAIPGMFKVVGKLFGLSIEPVEGVSVWHPDVSLYQIRDAQGVIRGEFYLDNYARENKRGGAWMDVCVSRQRLGERLQIPVAYLTCNLTPPVGNEPALLTHQEVTTLFHEFGHGLHHMLTQVDHAAVSGIAGVEWDAVELPSQFLENWCWERESLDMIAAHYQTGEPIPDELLQRAQAARNFQSAMQMVRQLEFAMFDMRIHSESKPGKAVNIQSVLDQVRQQVAVVPTPTFNRFQNGFAHIFAGGYAAGYFSYKWAEVLSADAFAQFETDGIFNADTGRSFLHNILEKGGTEDAMDLFVAFRGREPSIDALLRHSGLAA